MATFSGGQTYDPGSAGSVKLPNVPPFFEAKPLAINYPNWSGYLGGGNTGGGPDPYDFFRMKNMMIGQQMQAYPGLVNMQLGMLPQITQAQMAASQQAFPLQLQQAQQASQSAFEEQMRQYGIAAPQIGLMNWEQMNAYAPAYANVMRGEAGKTAHMLTQQLSAYDPQFYPTYMALGNRINQGLEAGYDLGSDLEREVQQGIRGAQSARGNYLGPAPTAAEAYGVGHEAVDLYNQRIGQAQNFLAGPSPTDKWAGLMAQFGPAGSAMGMVGQSGQVTPGLISQMAQPTAGMAAQSAANFLQNPYADATQQALGAYGTFQGALGQYGQQQITGQLGYNENLIKAADVNNTGQYNMYDKQFEQFLFDQGVSQGLYSTPSTGGAGGMQMAGQIGGAVVGAAGSVASAAAATGALAAICWLARAVLPERWKEVREWLFTKAPAFFRRAYIYNARRFVARGLAEADKARIREVMEKCLSKSYEP